MKDILNRLFNQEQLSTAQARKVLTNISERKYNDAEIAAFITVYLMRPIGIQELSGFQQALLEMAIRPALPAGECIDLCGTGGDGKDTFNISTLASFVVAGAGYPVVKHGNYGVSSVCGSSNVLEHLGYTFSTDNSLLQRQLETCKITFLHAPLFHPAMASVAPIRRQLQVKTFFNMLGPLVNPVQPAHQLVGVFNLELARIYQYLLEQGQKKYAIVHSLDGYDEISLTGAAKCIRTNGEQLLKPIDFGLAHCKPLDIKGGRDIASAAELFVKVLQGKGSTAQNNAIVANAGLAIQCFKPRTSLVDCVAEADESLKSGKALSTFGRLIDTCKLVKA